MNIPDKCPKCGAHVIMTSMSDALWKCGTRFYGAGSGLPDHLDQSPYCVKLQRNQLAAELDKLKASNLTLRKWVTEAYEEGYWDCHDRKLFDDAITTSTALARLDGRAEP